MSCRTKTGTVFGCQRESSCKARHRRTSQRLPVGTPTLRCRDLSAGGMVSSGRTSALPRHHRVLQFVRNAFGLQPVTSAFRSGAWSYRSSFGLHRQQVHSGDATPGRRSPISSYTYHCTSASLRSCSSDRLVPCRSASWSASSCNCHRLLGPLRGKRHIRCHHSSCSNLDSDSLYRTPRAAVSGSSDFMVE